MGSQGKLSTDGFAARTALFYGVSCILLGIHLPFYPAWLQAKGFDASQVGVLLACAALARILAVPSATHAADRPLGIRAVMILCACATALGFTLLGFFDGFWPIVALSIATAFAHTPGMALLDAYALRGLKARGLAYGPVRLWGSAAFIVANLGAGLAFDLIAARHLIWLLVASGISIVLVALMLPPERPRSQGMQSHGDGRRALWRDHRFLAVVVAASLVQSSHAVYYGFSTISWKAAGYDGTIIGSLWALGVLAEIVLFAVSGRFPPWLGPLPLLLIAAAGAVVRWSIMALDPPGWTLPMLQCLHALSFGASHFAAVAFIAHAAPDGRSATAQGYFSVMQGVTFSSCMLLAGYLYERVGNAAYAAMAVTALLAVIVTFAVWRTERRAER